MIDVSSVSDFNLHFVGQYSGRAFLVAGRFFDLAPDRFEWFSCEWYARNSFAEPKTGDRYVGQLPDGRDAIRYHSVDSLVLENPKQLSPLGQHLYDNWLARKAELAKHRTEPPVVILPPPLEPPMFEPKPEPKAKPIELPPKQPEQKKNPNPSIVRFGVYFGMIAAVASVVSWFIPGAKPWVAAIVPVIKAILSLFGV